MELKNKPPIWLIIMAFAATNILWGTTYFAVLIGLQTLPPFIMAAVRFLAAGLVLLLIVYLKGEKLVAPDMYKNMLLGIVILTGGQGLLFWSEQYIPSGTAAILVSTLPLWYVLLDTKNRHTYFSNKLILSGLILGFFGILLLFKKYLGASTGYTKWQLFGLLAVIGGCICWASGTLYYKNQVYQSSMFLNLGWQLVGGFLSSLLVAFLSMEFSGFSFVNVSMNSWLATLYLAVAGTLVAFVSFNWLLTVRPAAVVGTYAYVNPVIAVLLGWLLANEGISFLQIVGMLIILLSAFLVNSPKYIGNRKISNT
ncbi:MAG: EamA family transporter [Ginsengibacter sp.]